MSLQKGDRVVCIFPPLKAKAGVVRRITSVKEMDGRPFAAADGGEICRHCRCQPAEPTGLILSMWFAKVSEDD